MPFERSHMLHKLKEDEEDAPPPVSSSLSLRDAQAWSSVVLQHKMTLEHAAVDIDTDRVLYHLELELERALPQDYSKHAEYLCLSWHFGGIWKIKKLSDGNRRVHCVAWRTTEMNHEEVNELAKKVELSQQEKHLGVTVDDTETVASASEEDELPPCLFEWKMQLGSWGKYPAHWFLRDIRPPPNQEGSESTAETLKDAPIVAHLFAGFAPLEVQIEVNSITTVETVAQTFSADVTWEGTMPGLTAIREDSVIRELLDLLEFDASQFEFTNVSSMQEERPMATTLAFAGEIEFTDEASHPHAGETTTEKIHHLQFSRRVIAVFTEEMTLYNFPFDQQKLSFDFSTGRGVRESMRVAPASVEAGTFAIQNYKLGNVFDVVYHDKVFIGSIEDLGKEKAISFEIMLERRSGYYLTNVGIPSACITYLCFISYAPLSDGSLMDTDARLQVVVALVLTAVTFKNQVASVIPQVSYFTSMDKYVFFCFIVTCLVTLENALFPIFVNMFSEKSWSEEGLLGFSFGAFTIVNIAWGLYTTVFVKRRQYSSQVLLKVHEFSRVIAKEIPISHREAVLREYLSESRFPKWSLPQFVVTSEGAIYVELPDDSPSDALDKEKEWKERQQTASRLAAEAKTDAFRAIFRRLNPTSSLPIRSSSARMIPAARPNAVLATGFMTPTRRHSMAIDATAIAVDDAAPFGRPQRRSSMSYQRFQ